MKKLLVLIALTFATLGGVATVMTVHPQQAMADCSSGNC